MANYNSKLSVNYRLLLILISVSSVFLLNYQKAYSKEIDLPKYLTKDDLIKYYRGMGFYYQKQIKEGGEVYVGLNEKTICVLEFYGNKDSLTKIVRYFFWIDEKGKVAEITKINFANMVYLAKQIDEDSWEWVGESLKKAMSYMKQGKNYENRKIFGKNNFNFQLSFEKIKKNQKAAKYLLTIEAVE